MSLLSVCGRAVSESQSRCWIFDVSGWLWSRPRAAVTEGLSVSCIDQTSHLRLPHMKIMKLLNQTHRTRSAGENMFNSCSCLHQSVVERTLRSVWRMFTSTSDCQGRNCCFFYPQSLISSCWKVVWLVKLITDDHSTLSWSCSELVMWTNPVGGGAKGLN